MDGVGDLAIGAMASVNAIAMLCFMPVFGISQGAQPISDLLSGVIITIMVSKKLKKYRIK